MLKVTIIIPTLYSKNSSMLRRAIASIKETAHSNLAVSVVVVINNAPAKPLVVKKVGIRSKKKLPAIEQIASSINKGFAAAVNDGILYAKAKFHPDWYLVLNDDAVLHKDFFTRLTPFLQKVSLDAFSCGVCTMRGELESIGLRYYPTGLAFPRRTPPSPPTQPLFAGTIVMLSKKRAEKEIKVHGYVFNPLLFAYAEDLELSLRIHRDEGSIVILNDVLVSHAGSITAKRGSYFQLFYGYRNLMLVVLLLWPWQNIIRNMLWLALGQFYVLGMCIYKGYYALYPRIWWWIIKNYRTILLQRKQYAQR